MRARIFTEPCPGGRYWVYELLDMSRPEGQRLVATGVRHSWNVALRDAMARL